jgi:NNMT/PNMT/TEMT family
VSVAGDDGRGVLRNADVDWDQWPVTDYITENYRELHPSDAAVIDHHSAYLARFASDRFDRSLELGAGPNLYPLLLVSACSKQIDAVEPSAANVAYLRQQVADGPASHWLPFYERARQLNSTLAPDPRQALARVRVIHASAETIEANSYELASMHFVAEGVSDEYSEFAQVCRTFACSVRPGGHLIAAFMENLGAYTIADGQRWPAFPVDAGIIRDVFAPYTDELAIDRIDADATLPDYGYTGMVMLTARRSHHGAEG